jgi:spoIIIJ-associated protein
VQSVETSGKSIEEAVSAGLAQLGLSRDEASIEILAEGKAGLFGLGGEPARVRVSELAAKTLSEQGSTTEGSADTGTRAVEVLERLLELMGVDAQVVARPPETPGDGVGQVSAVLDVDGDDLGLLIGRRGETLGSLQYLLNLILLRQSNERTIVGVDVAGYRRRREESLTGLARRMADRVRATGRTITLEPMPPNERRIVHLALSEDQDVQTSSVGEGDFRKVALSRRDQV